MKAVVLEEVQQPLVVKGVPTPTIGAQEVLIRVPASGTRHAAWHPFEEWWRFTARDENTYPLIPGNAATASVIGFSPL